MAVEVVRMNQDQNQPFTHPFDVAVIGGGAAGLSAAVVLGRARRSVLVIDAGSPRNAPADGVHSYLTRDGISPAEMIRIGQAEVVHYGGRIIHGQAKVVHRTEEGFAVSLADGQRITARRLLVTTGLVDELPEIPGLRERWGRDVIHCPYCHGWEVRDQAIGVLGSGPMAVHQALLFRQWTADLILFTHTAPALTVEQAEQLAARGIRVVSGLIERLEVTVDRLTSVRLHDGTIVARQALVVGPRFVARAGVLASLGLQPVEHPLGVGESIAADPTGKTDVPGVWVAGNVRNLMAHVVTAAAEGVGAAAAINADLIAEETAAAVTASRARPTAAAEPRMARAS